MATIEPQEYKGNVFFPGAESVTPFRDGYFFYMVAVTYQDYRGHGQMSTHGLVAPRDRVQYGQLVNEILAFVRENTPGNPGTKVVQFFDIKPHGEFRAVGTPADNGDSPRQPSERPALP